MVIRLHLYFFLVVLGLFATLGLSRQAQAQCVPVLDALNGNKATYTPTRQFRCIPNGQPVPANFTITFSAPVSNFMFDPGDGTGPRLVAGPVSSITQSYGQGLFYYRIWFSGCTTDTVKGSIANDFNTTVPGIGFITPPAGFTNKRCVPEALAIVNNSPGMNGFTQFQINWGDNTTNVIDNTFGLSISHTYQPFTTGCHVKITVLYQNLCGVTPGGLSPSATYGEYYFMDRDTARVDPTTVILCSPTDVTINDVSLLNCLDSTNRMIRWERTHGFAAPLPFPGDGVYRPYNSAGARTLNIPTAALLPIPSDSLYQLKMTIKNQCGPDSAYASIRIVSPRQPVFSVINNNTCPGAAMNFKNNTPDPYGVQSYFWEWGDGNSETKNSANVSHTYLVGGSYWVKLTTVVKGYNGQICKRTDSIPVQVQKTVTPIVIASPVVGCDTLRVRVQNKSVNLATVVWGGWELGQNPTITAGSSYIPSIPGSFPSQAQVLSTNAADSSAIIQFKQYGRYIIKLKASSTGCPQLTDSDSLNLFARPTLRYKVSDTRICIGQTITVRDSSRIIPTSSRGLPNGWNNIVWTLDMGDGTIFKSNKPLTNNYDSPGASGRITSYTYASAGTYKIKLTVASPFGCPKVDSVTITVQPTVVPSFTFVQDKCDPTKVTIQNTSSLDTAKYEFSFSRSGTLYTRITKAKRDTFTVSLPWVGPGDTTFYSTVLRAVTGVPGDTCQASTVAINIKSRPAPVALFSSSVTDGCTPLNGVQFFNLSYNLPAAGGVTYTWTFGNGTTFTGQSPPLQNYVNTGAITRRDTVRLKLTAANGCSSSSFGTILTYPDPAPKIVAPDTICHNTNVAFSATGNGLATYTWRFTDFDGTTYNTPTVSKTLTNLGSLPITYNVTLDIVSSGGCIATTNKQITVMPIPSAGFAANPQDLCGNGVPLVALDGTTASTGAKWFYWSFGDGTNSTDSSKGSVTHTFPPNFGSTTVTYNPVLRVKSAFGCVSAPYTVSITLRPGITVGISPDTNKVCAPGVINFANVGYRNGVTYTWYVRTLMGTGLGASLTPNVGAGGFRYTFTNPSNVPSLQYLITLVGSTSSGFVQCADTTRDTITVYGVAAAKITLVSQTPLSGCSPQVATFKPDTTVAGSTYTWDFGNGAAQVVANGPANQNATYLNSTNSTQSYTVSLVTTTPFGCSSSATNVVSVKPLPTAAFSISDSLGCSPVTVRVTNNSSAAADNFVWLVNGAPYNFTRNPDPFQFANTSTTDTTYYTLRLVARGVGNACVDTSAPRIIKVYPGPKLVLTPSATTGCSPLNLTLNTTGTQGVSSLIFQKRLNGTIAWQGFDTTNGGNSTLVLTNTGPADQVWQIRMFATGLAGCTDSALTTVTVSPSIAAALKVLPDTAGCAPFTATLLNATTSVAANAFTWSINGVQVSATASSFQYLFNNLSATKDSVYTVVLTATNQTSGCPATATQKIYVHPVPQVNFDLALNPPSACSPLAVTYSYLGAQGASLYTWLFAVGDTLRTTADTAITRNYTNTGQVPAIRPITLIASNSFGCAVTVKKSLTINPLVKASFIQSAATGCSPISIFFTSTSTTGADVLEWIVDGVSRANGATFNYTFVNSGTAPQTFKVQLAARNSLAGACADTASALITINPSPVLSSLDVQPIDGCSPLKASLVATATGVTTYHWDFTDGTVYDTTAAALGHTFVNFSTISNRIYTPSVIALNAFGCADTLSKKVTVRPGSSAIIRVADSSGCTPLQIQFIGSSSVNANVFTWNFGDGSSPAYAANPIHVFTNSADTSRTFTVQLIALRAGGSCPDTTYKTIRVNPLPLVRFTPGDTTGCQPMHVRYLSSISGADSSRWTFTSLDGTRIYRNKNLVDTVYTNANPALTPVTVLLEAFNKYGCIANQQNITSVGPLAKAGYSQSADSGCSPLRARFTGNSTPGVLGTWLVNGQLVGNNVGSLTYTFDNPSQKDSVYKVQLVVYNPQLPGCTDTATSSLVVFPRPTASSVLALPNAGCSPLPVLLSGTGAGALTYNWSFGDGVTFDTTATTVNHLFQNNSTTNIQNYKVRWIVYSHHGCADTANTQVLVRPLVRAGFTVSDTAGCAPLKVQFNASTSFNANSYAWDFGDGLGTSGIRTPSYTFANTADTVVKRIVRLIADKQGVGCPDTAYQAIYVNPVPRAKITPADTAGCQPFRVVLQSLSQAADSLYWTITSGGAITTYDKVNKIDTVFTNLSSSTLTITPKLEAWNKYGCVNTATSRVQVAPFTQGGFSVNLDSSCTPFKLIATSSASLGSTVQWFLNGTPAGAGGSRLSVTLQNPNTKDSTVEVMQVVVNGQSTGCTDTIRKKVVIVASPRAGQLIATPSSGCSPLAVILQGSATGATSYNWNLGTGLPFTSNSQQASQLYVNTGSTATITYKPSLVAVNYFGCTDTARTQVQVRPQVKAGITASSTVGCTPLAVQFGNSTSVNADLFTWTFGDGTPGSTASSPAHTFVNNGDTVAHYTVILQADRSGVGCPDVDTITITVNPRAIAAATPSDTTGCQPFRVRFVAKAQRADSIRWSFTDPNLIRTNYPGRGVVDTTFANSGSDVLTTLATLFATNRYGCADSVSRTIKTNPLVQAGLAASLDSGCGPLAVQFTNTSATGNLVQWYVDGTLASQSTSTFSYTFSNRNLRDTTYQVLLVASSRYDGSCTDTIRKSIRVFGKPVAGVLFADPNAGCSPLQVGLAGSAVGGVSFSWNFGDGTRLDTSVQAVRHLYQNTSASGNQTFTAKLVAVNVHGCLDTAKTQITVRPLVRAGFTVSDTAGCAPLKVQFNASTSFNANSYAWDFGDGLGTSGIRMPSYTFANTADTVVKRIVRLIADKQGVGCPDTAYQSIYVNPVPRAKITPADTAGCQPFRVVLQSLSQAADSLFWTITSGGAITTYDKVNKIDTVFTNLSSSTLTITPKLEAWNKYGCVNTATSRVQVAPFTQGGFSVNQDSSCTPFKLIATSSASLGSTVQWFINGTPASPVGNALQATLYNFSAKDSTVEVMQVVVNRLSPQCSDTVRHKVVVLARPQAGVLTATPDAGCSPVLASLQGNATGATRFSWDFGDGTTLDTTTQQAWHRFANLGTASPRTFSVRLVVANIYGCADTARTQLIVHPNVKAGIVAVINQGCAPLGVQLSSASSVNANLFTWTFGDGTTVSNAAEPYHVFENKTSMPVQSRVTLIADKAGIGCPDTASTIITVNPKPLVAATPNDTLGCQPFALRFTSLTQFADSIRWAFGNGTIRTVYPNKAIVDTVIANLTADLAEQTATLWASNLYGCTDSLQRRIRINPLVKAGFAPSIDSGCTPLVVTFTNAAADGNRLQWYVDGNLISQSANGFNYTFLNPNTRDTTYWVSQVAYSRFGSQCADTIRKPIRVFGKPNAGVLAATPESGCSPLLVGLAGSASGAMHYNWNFGDGVSIDTTVESLNHTFVSTQTAKDQIFRPYLVALNAHGCSDTARIDITVRPGVFAGFSVSDSAGCAPLTILFSNGSRNANLYQWNFGDGVGTNFLTNPVYRFENNTDTVRHYTVTLVADKNGVGCPATATKVITVYPKPIAAFTPADTANCQPFRVLMVNKSSNAQSWTWTLTSPAGTAIYQNLPSIDTLFANLGSDILSTKVTLDITSAYGCAAQRIQTIRTFPLVQAQFTQSLDSGCSPLPVTFTNLSAAGNRSSWYIGGQYVGASTSRLDYTFINTSGRDSIVEILLAVQHPLAPGCVDTMRRFVKVFAKPIAGLLTAEPFAGCSPLVSTLRGSATGGVRYRLSFGDGLQADTNSQVITHTYINNSPNLITYQTLLIAISAKGCADTTKAALRVSPQTISRISLLDSAGCTPFSTRMSGSNSQNANYFQWDFGDNAPQRFGAEASHTYTNQSDTVQHYQIRLIADNQGAGCPDTAYRRVAVYPNPVAAIVPSATQACTPFGLRLLDESQTAGHTTKLVFTDGTKIDTVYMKGTSYDTVLVNSGTSRKTIYVDAYTTTPFGCQDSRRITLFVNPSLTAKFTKPVGGCSPLPVLFANTSNNPDELYEWDFGDGSATTTIKNPSHTFRYTGYRDTSFIVKLTSRSNAFYPPVCEVVYTDTIRISGRPVGTFSILPDATVRLPNNKITISNQTAYRQAWKYQWDFGDGTKSTDSSAQFNHILSGLFQQLNTTKINVRMVVIGAGACPDTVTVPLTILPIKPVADFDPADSGCAPLDVTFVNKSKWANTYYWLFGDGGSSTEQNPTHRYNRPGQFSVKLTATGPGGDSALVRENIITVFEVPSAAFTTYPKAPRKIKLPDDPLIGILRDPAPGQTYLWNFGDGTTSDTTEPRHYYAGPGSYKITLTVTSEHGCVASDTSSTPVVAENGGVWRVPNAFSPNPYSSSGGSVDNSGYNDVFYPYTEGVVEIDLLIFNRWGENLFHSTTVGIGWDGYVKGALAQSDTYVFKVKAKFADGHYEQKMGDVTLIR